MCTICTRVQINLHHPEGRSKFAPGCEFLKHRSHGQKYTRMQICTPGANLHPVQIAHINETHIPVYSTQSKSIPRANQATGDKENPNSMNSKPGPSTETPTHTECRDSVTMENHDGSKNKQSESPSRNVTDNTHING